jgi:serine/threonine protein kinase/tetratricopeptide (TPR) repeat protein
MTPERWREIQEKLELAMALEPGRRAAFLQELETADPAMRAELESLISQGGQVSSFLQSSGRVSVPELARGRETMIGRRLGPYQVTALLGEGGMGEVYRAFRADDHYKKQVAIKLVRAGHDSAVVSSRFKNERQILASLDHPHIGRLLDGGTTQEGVPYLVMELIEGKPIDEYCDDHKLDITERLRLFLKVCSAVQYAHSRLIVHRDLKPGNILVPADGQPKLLDFGIAKILDPVAAGDGYAATMTLVRALTPGYASPEQVKGETITTASDVYSLGVILYELLTGHSPYRVAARSADAIERAMLEFEPEKPSSVVRRLESSARAGGAEVTPVTVSAVREGSEQKLRKRLNGDLDKIVLMALRKEPERRYSSVEQLGEDIRHHLKNLPVLARKDTAGYRASKFVIRHKVACAATVIVAVLLLSALLLTLHEARVARQQAELANQQRVRAEKRFNDVRNLANSLMFEIHDSIRDLPGATKARELLVTRAREYLDSLALESGDPALQRELAAAYDRIGDVQGYTGAANLTDFSGAAQSYAKALAIRESLAAANPGDLTLRKELTDEYFRVASALENIGDFEGGVGTLRRAEGFIRGFSSDPNDRQQRLRMAGIYYYTARALEKTGDFPGALKNYQQAASIAEPIVANPKAGVIPTSYFAAYQFGIAKMLARVGRIKEADASASKAIGILRKLSDDNPANATLREYLAEGYEVCADVAQTKGDLEGALRYLRQNHAIYVGLVAADPGNKMASADLAWGDLGVGEILLQQNKVNEALQRIREAIQIFQKSTAPEGFWYAVEMGQSYLDLGKAYAALAELAPSESERVRFWREATSWNQKALAIRSTSPNRRDANGHDQIDEIRQQLARCNAARATQSPSPLARRD